MAEMVVAFLEETAARQIARATAPEPRHETRPLPEPGADGTVSLTVDAVRVEAVSRAPRGELSVTVDGTPVDALAGCVAHGRPSRATSDRVWPGTRRVGADAPLVPETWTARLHGFSEDFPNVAFTVSGSVTGEDGAGRSSEDFRSGSFPLRVGARSARRVGRQTHRVAADTGEPLPDPLEVTWRSRFLCDDVVEVPVEGGPPILFTPLAAGLEPGARTLRLTTSGDTAARIEPLRVTPARRRSSVAPSRGPRYRGGMHAFPIRVFYEDTDLGGIVYHANYLKYAERGRSAWIRALGIDQNALRDVHGLVFAVHRIEADFRAPARLDDALTVHTRLAEARSRVRFVLAQEVTNAAGDTIFAATVTLVTMRVAGDGAGRPVRLPAELRRLLPAPGA